MDLEGHARFVCLPLYIYLYAYQWCNNDEKTNMGNQLRCLYLFIRYSIFDNLLRRNKQDQHKRTSIATTP